MECQFCKTAIRNEERYASFYHCHECHKDYDYEWAKPKDNDMERRVALLEQNLKALFDFVHGIGK